MGATTGFHGDFCSGRQLYEIRSEDLPFEFMPLQDTAGMIDFAHGKRMFVQVDADECRIDHETSSGAWVGLSNPAWLHEAEKSGGSLFLLAAGDAQPAVAAWVPSALRAPAHLSFGATRLRKPYCAAQHKASDTISSPFSAAGRIRQRASRDQECIIFYNYYHILAIYLRCFQQSCQRF